MRFDVPNFGDPSGSFAGAIFPDMGGRDLSGYDALTFWAKATKAATINEIGFGNDFGENKYLVTKQNLRISTGWAKYTIPIPDPGKLTIEKGLFWYSEGPEDGDGYTFWIDELQFEKLGTVAQPRPAIFGGADLEAEAFIDIQGKIPDEGLTQTFNLESGVNETVIAAPSYFAFKSSDVDVVQVSELGVLSPVGLGTAKITATLGAVKAQGSALLEVSGGLEIAPVPTLDPATVISIFSDAYTNVPVDNYNGFFGGQTTTGGAVEIIEDVENIIIPSIVERMDIEPFDVLFLTGVGEVFPYIRSHNILNNLQKRAKEKPTLMFFPGIYQHSLERGASLDLFGCISDDKYYRAFNILDRAI